MNAFLDKYANVPTAQRWLLFLILLAVVFVGLFFLFIQPNNKRIKGTTSQIAQVQQEINELTEKKRKQRELLKQIEALQLDLVRVQNQLPDSSQIPNLLQQIHDQARTAGLQIDRFERTQDIPKDHYIEIPVRMSLSGTYDQLANFLFYVGKLTRIVNVRDLAISTKSVNFSNLDSQELGQLSVTALATTFRHKPSNTAAANESNPGAQ